MLFKDLRTAPRSQVISIFVVLALLILLCVFPFLSLLKTILFSSGTFGFGVFADVLANPNTRLAMGRTLAVSLTVAVVSTIIATPLAWFMARSDLPGGRRLKSWLCLPYTIPPYIGAIAWIFLANPTTGLLNQLAGFQLLNVYTFTGLVWVESSFMYTFILLTAMGALERLDASLEEAARLSGASNLRVFFDITLPLIRPALLSGALLTLLATAASFGVPALIGNPARLYLLTTQIYTYQKMGTVNGLVTAGALSLILLLAACLVLFLNQYLSRRSFQTVGGKAARASVVELGKWKKPILAVILFFWFVVFLLPLLGILISALSKIQGALAPSNFTLRNFSRTLFEVSETPRALMNSLWLGVVAATLASFFGVMLAYIQTKTKLPGRRLLNVFASLPYSVPGTVVSLSLILMMSSGFFGLGSLIYNTMGMLLLAYIIKYLSFAVKTSSDGFQQIDSVLAEAARVSGATWAVSMRTIWFPLMRPAVVAAWFLIFLPVISELTMTLMLAAPGQETVGTLIYQLQEYADASGGGASVLALLVVVSVVIVNWFVRTISKGKYGL